MLVVHFQQQDFGVGFTDRGVIYKIGKSAPAQDSESPLGNQLLWMKDPIQPEKIVEEVVFLRFEKGNIVRPKGMGLLPHQSNYFRGNDPSKWLTGIKTYSEVSIQASMKELTSSTVSAMKG